MQELQGKKIVILARNPILREGLIAQVRAAGGEAISPRMRNGDGLSAIAADAILLDAGSADEPDLSAWPEGDPRAIVLLTPGARGQLARLKAAGFGGYLVKPVRQPSLVERICDPSGAAAFAEPRAETGPAHTAAPKTAAQTPSPPDNRLKILLAEDNAINAMLTRELLRRRGHAVAEVTTGADAVRAVREERFDLVLTDIHMPGLDGVEATRRIREEEERDSRPRVAIVALTADALETGRRACQEAGMDGFLTKPVDPAELDSVISELFPERHSGPREAAA